jgi:hypothetical protein
MDKSTDSVHIETHLSGQDEVKPQVMGNVKLLQGNETVLVPTPSPDPNGKSKTCLHTTESAPVHLPALKLPLSSYHISPAMNTRHEPLRSFLLIRSATQTRRPRTFEARLTRHHRSSEPAVLAQMGDSRSRCSIRLLCSCPRLRTGPDLHLDFGLLPWRRAESKRSSDIPNSLHGRRKFGRNASGHGNWSKTRFLAVYHDHGRGRNLVCLLEEFGYAHCWKEHHVSGRRTE